MKSPSSSKRYFGLDLAGAKNDRTTLSVLEYFPKEQKIFLLDVDERLGPTDTLSADEVLLQTIQRHAMGNSVIGVNAPLELPPCLSCDRATCTTHRKCSNPSLKWTIKYLNKVQKSALAQSAHFPKVREFIPYTQRPVEVWLRYGVVPRIKGNLPLDIDETLGGTKGPLAARMFFLKKALKRHQLMEVFPKLSVLIWAKQFHVPTRSLQTFRQLELGQESRMDLLEAISDELGVFVYQKDLKILARSLPAFDSFIAALTALHADSGLCEAPPPGFPVKSGWIQYPQFTIGQAKSR